MTNLTLTKQSLVLYTPQELHNAGEQEPLTQDTNRLTETANMTYLAATQHSLQQQQPGPRKNLGAIEEDSCPPKNSAPISSSVGR
ncbi:hypothetical protein E2C01_072907 [Portunus trituberculatus]|uniref:Uncharacterized protein n=1 Tax=Portunus trituberculatus TaxID=210409 RepID=A0A5B7HZB7_PORTR|nr:hypothetical protein [Portunus trituberculatus]